MDSSIPEEQGRLLIVITGPTAVGKTKLALGLTQKLSRVEIVSCDSMAVYKEMNIGTSKPSPEMRKKVPHHLIDVCSVNQEFNVARYVQLATTCIEDITCRNKIPVMVGGSLLYLYSVMDGIFKGPGKNPHIREKLISIAKTQGLDSVYAQLRKIDPQSAANIHPHDLRRIVRALEVWYVTGRRISELKNEREGIYDRYDTRIFALIRERKKIYEAIDRRVDEMISRGLVEEVESIWRKGMSITAYQGHGYKEIIGYLEGKYSLEEAIRLTKRNTRRYAKRQISWLKRDSRVKWINVDDFENLDEMVSYILKELNRR